MRVRLSPRSLIDVIWTLVPAVHNMFFGSLAKSIRSEQAVVLLDEQGVDANVTDTVKISRVLSSRTALLVRNSVA